MDIARCTLIDAHLGKEFWGNAVTAVAHINRLPSHVHEYKSPYEGWKRNLPSVSHLRVFGSKPIYLSLHKNEESWAHPRNRVFWYDMGRTRAPRYTVCMIEKIKNIILSRDVVLR